MQIIHCGTQNPDKLFSKTWAISFKSVYYAFMPEGKDAMRITKISKQEKQENRILESYKIHIQDARVMWKQLHKRPNASKIQYNYYHD